jgi:hypothetical protein
MKNKMLMLGAVSLVSLMTNIGFASTTHADCTDDGATFYVCRTVNDSSYWVNVDDTSTQKMSLNGAQKYAEPNSHQCDSGTHIYDTTLNFELSVAPAVTSNGYDVGITSVCYTLSTAGVSMWKKAADLIYVTHFR